MASAADGKAVSVSGCTWHACSTAETLDKYGMSVYGSRKGASAQAIYTAVGQQSRSTISSLLFLVICVLLIQILLYLRGSLGSQAERVARERRRPSVPEVGNTNVGTTHGYDTATGGVFLAAGGRGMTRTIPQTMQAARYHGPGPALQVETVPVPTVGAGEALIRITHAGVCRTELHFLSGLLNLGIVR